MQKSVSKGTCARHILQYSNHIATAMSNIGYESSCSNCGVSKECQKCVDVNSQQCSHYHSGYSASSPDLGLSAINGTQHTIGDQSQYTGPLTSTVVQSPRYVASPECFRAYENEGTMSHYGWSADMDYRHVPRFEPSGSESDRSSHLRPTGYNNSSSMSRVPCAPPCSFVSSMSQSVPEVPYNSPSSAAHGTPRFATAEELGPRPQCIGQEFSPAKGMKNNHRGNRSRESTRFRTIMPRNTAATAHECEPEAFIEGPELPDLSVVSDAPSIVGKRMCCIGLPGSKSKTSKQRTIGRKIKDFTKSFGQIGKSSKSSLQTLTVL